MRPKIAPFKCPITFKTEYLLFQDEYSKRNYANATIISNNATVQKFILYLNENNINSSKKITTSLITDFLKSYSHSKPKYVATILYVLRNYLHFLYKKGFLENDISKNLPSV